MLRITRVNEAESVATLRLEGKLSGPWVEELLRVCGLSEALHLDLAAVSYVDGAGLELLRALLRRGVRVGPCSGFVSHLLHMEQA